MIKRPKSNTCILAIKTKQGKIMIGADSRCSWDFSQAQNMAIPKVCKRSGLILAATGDSSLCEGIVMSMKIPPIGDMEPTKYFNYPFYERVIKLLRSRYFTTVSDDLTKADLKIPEHFGVEVVIACKRELWSLRIYNPSPSNDNYNGLVEISRMGLPYGTGCGGQWAWASIDFESMNNLYIYDEKKNTYRKMTDREKVEAAIRVANKNSPGCGGAIDIQVED